MVNVVISILLLWGDMERNWGNQPPWSSVAMGEFSTVVGGSHHLVTLVSCEHNTGETVFASIYTSPCVCPNTCGQGTKKEKGGRGLAEVFGGVTGQRAEERTWKTPCTLNHLLSRQSLFFSCLNSDLCHLLSPPPFLILVLSFRTVSQHAQNSVPSAFH